MNIVLKKITKITILTTLFVVFLFVFASPALALDYTYISEPPGGPDSTGGGDNFVSEYLRMVFGIVVSGAAVLAVLMIVVGGARYLFSSVTPSEKEAAKSMIWGAIYGLLIILISWLVLYAINPDLVDGVLAIPALSAVGTFDWVPPSYTDPSVLPHEDEGSVRDELADGGVRINNNPCPVGTRYQDVSGGCTSVGGLNDETVQGVIALNDACDAAQTGPSRGCTVVVTGGSELGHTGDGAGTHAGGDKVDLRKDPNTDAYIRSQLTQDGTTTVNGVERPLYVGNLAGSDVVVIDEGNHWDINYL